ncbi:hypothetical protein GCM10009738_52560 [Kitasatospora viridis]
MDQPEAGEADGSHGWDRLTGTALGGDGKQMRLHDTLLRHGQDGLGGTDLSAAPRGESEWRCRAASLLPADQNRINARLPRRSEPCPDEKGRC